MERKLYKTKFCKLYQRGYCHRDSCSFAHGDAELRRSIEGRRDYRGTDLRLKLDRRHSPVPRYSPARDASGRNNSNGDSPRSLGQTRKRKKKQHLDGHSDFAGGMGFSEGNEDKTKGPRQESSRSKDFLDEQLRKAQSEIRTLEDHKHGLEVYLKDKLQEASSLTSKIQALEIQLSSEKDESKRIASRIKKFVKVYNRQLHLEDELKRSQVQLQKLSEQLDLDVTRTLAGEDDSGLNTITDGEIAGKHVKCPYNDLRENVSPSNKRRRVHLEAKDISNQGNITKDQAIGSRKTRLDKISRWNVQSNAINDKKVEANDNTKKTKVSESGILLPSTSMAAYAVNEVDNVETEENLEAFGTASETEMKVAFKVPALPFLPPPPPPPPIPENHARYRGDDEKESMEVDIV